MAREGYISDAVAQPVGPYSQAARIGGAVYLSGQVAQDPISGRLIEGDVAAQTEQIFRNLEAVLHAAGRGFADVVKLSVFLTDTAGFAAVNAVFARYFDAPYPARTTVEVASLPLGAKIEIDLVAQ